MVVSGEGGRTTPDPDIQDAPETDPISQALAALEKRLAIELKVLWITAVQLLLASVICACILCTLSVIFDHISVCFYVYYTHVIGSL